MKSHRPLWIGFVPALLLNLSVVNCLCAKEMGVIRSPDETEQDALEAAKKHLESRKKIDELFYWEFHNTYMHGNLLHKATLAGHRSIIKFLAAKGANLNKDGFEAKGDFHGSTALALAAWAGQMETVKLLVSLGADASHKDLQGPPPLYFAAARGDMAMAKFLLSKGGLVNPANVSSLTNPLHGAAENGHFLMVEWLLANGADVSAGIDGFYGHTALHGALKNKFGAIATLLILKGTPVKPREKKENPLIPAAAVGDRSLLELMIDRGSPVNATFNGTSPLHRAVQEGHYEAVEFLLAKGADVNPFPSPARSPLHQACENRDFKWVRIVRLLAAGGADVNAVDFKGNTPLHLVLSFDMVEPLIKRGASVNARNKEGRTPLHEAVRYRHSSVIRALLENHADCSIQDQDGKTPIQMTTDPSVLKLFKNP